MICIINLQRLPLQGMNTIEILKSKGLKKTAQRIMLINILHNKGISLTEKEIKNEMGEVYDRITFYRTVHTLLDANIIHRITVDDITVKYALCHLDGNYAQTHAHFFCKQCQGITCLDNTPTIKYRLPDNFVKEECEVLIKGICAKCSKTNLKPNKKGKICQK